MYNFFQNEMECLNLTFTAKAEEDKCDFALAYENCMRSTISVE